MFSRTLVLWEILGWIRSEKNEDAPVGWPGHSAAPRISRLTFAILPPILRLAPLRPETSEVACIPRSQTAPENPPSTIACPGGKNHFSPRLEIEFSLCVQFEQKI